MALALVWFFVAGVGNLLVWRSIPAEVFPPASPASTFVAALNGPLFTSLFGIYGATAIVAAVTAWQMHRWMLHAFLVWSVSAVFLGVLFVLAIPAELILGGKPAAAALTLGAAAILWLIYRYLQRVRIESASAAL